MSTQVKLHVTALPPAIMVLHLCWFRQFGRVKHVSSDSLEPAVVPQRARKLKMAVKTKVQNLVFFHGFLVF